MKRFFLCYAALLLVFSSCSGDTDRTLDRENLFTLGIGRMEDQIDLYNLEGGRSSAKTRFVMRDGLFYISDGNGAKIGRYTSFGSLLFMIYNDETNPPPITLRPGSGASTATRWAFSYPLREPGEIAVDERKHIYAEDRLESARFGYDAESRSVLDSVVLHFDEEGRFLWYLGREGVGGSPFPRITGLYASVNNELAVVCRLSTGWTIYWFAPDGALLYLIPVSDDATPVPQDRASLVPALESIAAAPDERKLYLKVDYYRPLYDTSTNTRLTSEIDSSVVWIMNITDGSYAAGVDVPFFEYSYTVNNRRVTENLLYSMMGVAGGGKVFLSFPGESGYSLLILSAGGPGGGLAGGAPEQRRVFIPVDNQELEFNEFSISDEGILSGFFATDWEARMVWWRTDTVLEEMDG